LFFSNFDKLAHGPRGTKAKNSLYVYRLHPNDGSLVLLNIHGADVVNPAFSRYHPYLNVVYTCTEDIDENGLIYAYSICPDGELVPLGDAPVDAGGTSTCYLTIDKAAKFLLCVNYWDSTLGVIPLDPVTGAMTGPVQHKYDPKGGNRMVAAGRIHGGVNHSDNDSSTIQMRQVDPHSHTLVLDPFLGVVAYVPDLGKDLIREFYYDRVNGKIETEINVMPSGLCTGHPDGPRYFEFHPTLNIAYVVNELSSTVAVFEVDRAVLNEIAAAAQCGEDMTKFRGRTTLRLIQSIKTVPPAFPTTMNTCGRMCAHRSGRFVVVSNRGHQSIAIFRVHRSGPRRGELSTVGYFHTRGETPRHFQFDNSGQYLLVANQDSDSIAVFSFNLSTGVITYTGNEYGIPSPNFICCCPPRDDGDKEVEMERGAISSVLVSNMQVVQRAGPQNDSMATTTTSSGSEVSVEDGLATNPAKSNNNDELLEQARNEIARLTLLLEERHIRM
jgi:6-phosphogluconolactonase (cycloisomerase 2 family)